MTSPQDSTPGRCIEIARERAGLSRTQLAARIEDRFGKDEAVTARSVQRWEEDAVDIPMSRVQQVAAVLGIRPSSLMAPAKVGG